MECHARSDCKQFTKLEQRWGSWGSPVIQSVPRCPRVQLRGWDKAIVITAGACIGGRGASVQQPPTVLKLFPVHLFLLVAEGKMWVKIWKNCVCIYYITMNLWLSSSFLLPSHMRRRGTEAEDGTDRVEDELVVSWKLLLPTTVLAKFTIWVLKGNVILGIITVRKFCTLITNPELKLIPRHTTLAHTLYT